MKEQRRQHAADEERKRADEELAKIQPMLMLLSVLAVGCTAARSSTRHLVVK